MMAPDWSQNYSLIQENLEELDEHRPFRHTSPYLQAVQKNYALWWFHIFIGAGNIALLITSLILFFRVQHYNGNECLKETSLFSPILDMVDINLTLWTFNGALRDNTSIWRMPPSPEVDAAWDYISAEDMQLITVSSQSILQAGKSPLQSVKAPLSWGFGTDAFIAQVEVFHQIHCLNELRKELYHDYYYKSPPTELHLSHKSHCVHMLLQTLMCNADVGIITHNWVHDEAYDEPKTRPFPDFNVTKKCRDFDAVMEWLRKDGGVPNLADKFPMQYPGGIPIFNAQGYTQKQGLEG